MNINEIDFETGDLLLFHEIGNCISSMIELCTKSKYSHCAIVLKDMLQMLFVGQIICLLHIKMNQYNRVIVT